MKMKLARSKIFKGKGIFNFIERTGFVVQQDFELLKCQIFQL